MKIDVKQYQDNAFNVTFRVAVDDKPISPQFDKLEDAVEWRKRYEKELEDELMPYFDIAEEMVNQKFFCNECGHIFAKEVQGWQSPHMECPSCKSYKISLQFDLWDEPDPEVDDQG